jgi:hypothetical protein
VDYDEHCTVLVVIEDLPKCLFFAMKFTCPCPTLYAHMDATQQLPDQGELLRREQPLDESALWLAHFL